MKEINIYLQSISFVAHQVALLFLPLFVLNNGNTKMVLISAVIPAFKDAIGMLEKYPWEFMVDEVQLPPLRGREEISFFDAPTTLYKVGENETLNSLIFKVIDFIQRLLARPNNTYCVVAYDRKTPAPKYTKIKTGAIPESPCELFETEDQILAWERHFNSYIGEENRSNLSYMIESIATKEAKAPSPYELLIPENWRTLLDNRACKEFVSLVFCRAIFHFTLVPENKTLVLLGPNGFIRQRKHNTICTPDSIFNIDYKEADFFSGSIIRRLLAKYPGRFDCTVYSDDGDTFLYTLLGQTNRISNRKPKNILFDQDLFDSEIWVVRHFMSKKLVYYNINNLWHSIQNRALKLSKDQRFKFSNPVATYVLLCLLNDNDYVDGFPGIGPKTIFETFNQNAKHLVPLVYEPMDHERINIDCHQILKLILHCCSARRKTFKFDPSSRDLSVFINSASAAVAKKKEDFTLANFKTRMANLHWFLIYMVASQTGEEIPTGVERNEDGLPIFGYESNLKPTRTGRLQVVKSEKTSIAHLKGNFHD